MTYTYDVLGQSDIHPFRGELPDIKEQDVHSLSESLSLVRGLNVETQDKVTAVSRQQSGRRARYGRIFSSGLSQGILRGNAPDGLYEVVPGARVP